MSILEAKNILFEYPGILRLQVDRFCLEKNRIAIIIGPNSSGKSTLCKLLAKIETPQRGTVDVFGDPPVLVWQDRELFPGTVKHNLRLAARAAVGPGTSDEIVRTLIERLELRDWEDSDVSEISGGVKQRLAIARALAATRRLIRVFDEPSNSQDANQNDNIAEHIKFAHQRAPDGGTIVVTHDPKLVLQLSGEHTDIYTLEAPRRRKEGEPYEPVLKGPKNSLDFIESPPTVYAAEFLGYENVFYMNDASKGVAMRNLVKMEGDRRGGTFCVIPLKAIQLGADASVPTHLLNVARSEFRSGGVRMLRLKWSESPIELLAMDRRSLRLGKWNGTDRRITQQGQVSIAIDVEKCLVVRSDGNSPAGG